MVCLGNICRSPLAQGILRSKLPNTFTVDSCGTIDMHEGKNPDHRSVKTASNHKIDISEQKSRMFDREDFENYDHIFCMDHTNVKDVLSLAKSEKDRRKVSLILENNKEVPDPYWGELNDFENVFQLLDEACDKISNELLSK